MPLLVLLLLALPAGAAVAVAALRHPRAVRRPAALAVIAAGGVVVALLAVVVRSSDGLVGVDHDAEAWADRHASDLSTAGLKLVTTLGEAWFVALAGVAIALIELTRTRNRWVVPFLLAVVVGDKLITLGIKQLIDRARPELEPIAATLGPSFPSGHSSTAAAFWAAAAFVAGRWVGVRARAALTGLAVGIAVAVAASRVLLGVHWLTDVVAGLALGWAWFAVCAVAFERRLLAAAGPAALSRAGRAAPRRRRRRGRTR